MPSTRSVFISKNLKFEDFKRDGFIPILSAVIKILELITLAVFPLALHVILTQSSEKMRYYKFLLSVQITVTTVLNTLVVLTNPIIIFPFKAAYMECVFECDYTMTKIMYLVIVGSILCMATSTALQLAYRIMVTYDDSHILKKLCRPKVFTFITTGVFVVATTVLFTPIAMDPPMGKGLKEILQYDFPAVIPIFEQHEFIMGYLPDHQGPVNFAITSFFAVSVGLIPLAIWLLFLMVRRLKEMKKSLQKHTYKVHAMLSRALYVQVSLTVILLIPLFVCLTAALVFSSVWGKVLLELAKLSISIYSICEVITIMYFITPYREYLKKLFCLKNNRIENHTSSSQRYLS
uniref:Serpentine Receptor, class H n=1 Tax=Panagrellus redivivus TaxID=6233 RepID=A0A7E4V898_PANRE